MTRITGSHHVLSIKYLLGEFWNSEGPVLLRSTGCERCKPWHEEVQSWKGNHVDCKLAQISIELAWEAEAGRHTRHSGRHKMVKVSICWGGQLQCPETDIIQRFIVNTEALICIFDQLVYRQCSIIRLDHGV